MLANKTLHKGMYNIMQEWYNYINDNMHIQADLIGESNFWIFCLGLVVIAVSPQLRQFPLFFFLFPVFCMQFYAIFYDFYPIFSKSTIFLVTLLKFEDFF